MIANKTYINISKTSNSVIILTDENKKRDNRKLASEIYGNRY